MLVVIFMNIDIKSLSADLVDDYINFFDHTPHDTDGQKCYCVCWCSADHSALTDSLTTDYRRSLAKEYISLGTLQGYLAYDGAKVIGWCNANERNNCTKCASWLKYMQEVKNSSDERVKSIFCFVISSEYRRMGIATALLKRVISDAKASGFDYVEAYPRLDTKSYSNFQGYSSMYEKAGFEKVYDTTDKNVMRKQLL